MDREDKSRKVREMEEFARRLAVLLNKEAGMMIECVERHRLFTITFSIMLRLSYLKELTNSIGKYLVERIERITKEYNLNSIQELNSTSEVMSPTINMLIDTYNNIIKDIKHHYAEKDRIANTLKELSPIKEPREMFDRFLELYNYIQQAEGYITRWMPNC
ncbi:MAG: hypothetical protein QXQ57_07720 [Sulfolobales archaeon]